MSIKERFLDSLGLGKIDPQINELVEEFLSKHPGTGIADVYGGNSARLRKIRQRLPDGTCIEESNFYQLDEMGNIIVILEGTFHSDGK